MATEQGVNQKIREMATALDAKHVGRDVAHTPGPWQWKYDGDSKAIVTAARNSSNPRKAIMDYVLAKVEDFSPEATKSNARLIAAAPEILAELKTAYPLCLTLCTVAMNPAIADYLPYGLLDEVKAWLRDSQAHAAIAKAEGR